MVVFDNSFTYLWSYIVLYVETAIQLDNTAYNTSLYCRFMFIANALLHCPLHLLNRMLLLGPAVQRLDGH